MSETSKNPQLRIAVNSRCERACFYCRPSGEAVSTPPDARLSLNGVVDICSVAKEMGITEVKITGGDPALWEPLIACSSHLKSEVGINELHIISRNPRIGSLAPHLADAGVDLINISLDTLVPSLHQEITGIGDLRDLLKAVQRCVETGVPCKINMVVIRGVNDREVGDMIDFCERTGIRTLKILDLIEDMEDGSETYAARFERLRGKALRDVFLPLSDYITTVQSRAESSTTVFQGGLGHPMVSCILPSGLEVVFKDHSTGKWYGSVCCDCTHYPCHDALMALRVTADGRLQFCLLREDNTIDIKQYLTGNITGLRTAMKQAIQVYRDARFSSVRPARI